MLSSNITFNQTTFAHEAMLEEQHNVHSELFDQLAQTIRSNQWIWFTSQSIRPSLQQLSASNIPVNQVIQLKASAHLTEFEVARKAIKSGNASALVVSKQLSKLEQNILRDLSDEIGCQLFFIDSAKSLYH
ncbi:SulA-like leucine-rich domain-containing protein [Vibrio sp.]|nr:SulA-like leucine-rich domain-containing protein [Vibrio sp.]